ncbi:MAG: hypothetical protein R3B40_15485 [Polyangiales bacterium]|nr:hypothetical protein [Myxococcales bacterium]MCB9658363.1 hypothetical protein [Sandaracinaceae bacterium]
MSITRCATHPSGDVLVNVRVAALYAVVLVRVPFTVVNAAQGVEASY